MNRASAFGRASNVASNSAFSAISYDVYKDPPQNINLDKMCLDDLSHYTQFVPLPDTHLYASFNHLGGTLPSITSICGTR